MLFRNRNSTQSDTLFNSIAFSICQKARTPIRQSINFSEEMLTKAAVRRAMTERSSSRVYGVHGTIEMKLVGHLLNVVA